MNSKYCNLKLIIFFLIFLINCNMEDENNVLGEIDLTINTNGYLASIECVAFLYHINDTITITQVDDNRKLELYKKFYFTLTESRNCTLDSLEHGKYVLFRRCHKFCVNS